MYQIYISGAHKSSGKTTISMGLCAALRQKGLRVQPFKKGPDYIDPMWLSQASQRACTNLDFHTMSDEEIRRVFTQQTLGCDIALIEGNKGLFDGVDVRGSNCNGAMAKLLDVPVVLVIDTAGMTRGIAPLLLGYQAFDRDLRISGVIFNRVGGPRHEGKLRQVVEAYTDIPVLGAVYEDKALNVAERHLGLIPSNEAEQSERVVAQAAQRIAQQVDLDALLMCSAFVDTDSVQRIKEPIPTTRKIRIGIARDSSFGFYYPGDLVALENAGAELVPFNTLTDQRLPDVDGLFIGGGFPETHAQALEKNYSMRAAIRDAIEDGMPTYAECGGLMYLSRSIKWGEHHFEMAGAIEADTVMHARPKGRGYVVMQETGFGLWPLLDNNETLAEFPAHEFHYSNLENISAKYEYAYDVKRGYGIDGKRDGIVYKNCVASYVHLRDVAGNRWASRFVSFVDQIKQQKRGVSDRHLAGLR